MLFAAESQLAADFVIGDMRTEASKQQPAKRGAAATLLGRIEGAAAPFAG